MILLCEVVSDADPDCSSADDDCVGNIIQVLGEIVDMADDRVTTERNLKHHSLKYCEAWISYNDQICPECILTYVRICRAKANNPKWLVQM